VSEFAPASGEPASYACHVEELLGGPLYSRTVASAYRLAPEDLFEAQPAKGTLLEQFARHFGAPARHLPRFERFVPAHHFMAYRTTLLGDTPDCGRVLERFGRLFARLNEFWERTAT
jgi:hypothetical protein